MAVLQHSRVFNLIVAASNLYALRAFNAWMPLDPICASLTAVAMGASTLYHLVERHKHGLAGCGSGSLREHTICINIDRVAAVTLTLYILFNYPSIATRLLPSFAGALLMLGVSELPHLFPSVFQKHVGANATRVIYTITHSAWHMWAFHNLFLVANAYINA